LYSWSLLLFEEASKLLLCQDALRNGKSETPKIFLEKQILLPQPINTALINQLMLTTLGTGNLNI
jgi:hypothetical protein